MRFARKLMALSSMLVLGMGRPLLALQGPVKVELTTSGNHGVWYTDPFWLSIGGVVALIVIVLAIMASRNGSKTNTTIVR